MTIAPVIQPRFSFSLKLLFHVTYGCCVHCRKIERLAALAGLLLISSPRIASSNTIQDFETWPTTVSWGTTQHDGWTLSDGQVRVNRGGFAPPIDLRCGWLHDFDDSTNSWLLSPLFTNGVVFVRLWTRHDTMSGGSSFAALESSTNEIDWMNVDAFTIVDGPWTQKTFTVNNLEPTRLRIRKTGDTTPNAYAGLDNVEAIVDSTTTSTTTSTTSTLTSTTTIPFGYAIAAVHYPLEAYGGTQTDTVADASGNGQDGIADGGVFGAGQPTAGINCNSAVFPGGADIFVAGEAPPSSSRFRNQTLDLGTSDYTIAMWVRATDAYSVAAGPDGLNFAVFFLFDDPVLYLSKGGTISYEVPGDNATMRSTVSNDVPVDSQWHHVAIVVNRYNLGGNPSAIYVDTVNVTGADVLENTPSSLSPAGSEFWRWGRSLVGQADDFAIFKQALSLAQIETLNGITSTTSTSSTTTDSTTSSTTSPPTVIRGPYLQTGTPSSVTVRWRTDLSTDTRVAFGNTLTNLLDSVSDTNLTVEHEVTVTGLVAETKYYYAIGSTVTNLAGNDANHFFRTAPVSQETKRTRIWVIGDSGTANSNAATVRDAYDIYTGTNLTDAWVMLGDNAYPSGSDAHYQAAVFEMYPSLLRNTTLWATLGNHDGSSAQSATQSGPYYDIFSFPRDGQAGGLASGTEAYYSFDHANIHFICLDSYDTDRSTNGTMMTWLRNDLAATMQDWIIAYWHHPPYSRGSHNSDFETELVEMRTNALPILEDAGVDLVLTGHSHSYERSYLLNRHYGKSSNLNTNSMIIDAGDGRPGGDGAYFRQSTTGTVYVVAGSSGRTTGGALNHPVMFLSLNQLGSLVLDINGSILHAAFIDDEGDVRDNFSIVKPSPGLEIDHFAWGLIKLTNSLGIPFAASLTAKASNDATVVEFSGGGNLAGLVRGAHREDNIGTGALPWIYPMSTFHNDARTQIIYMTNEIGSAGSVTGLAINVSTIPGQTMNNWTIRMKHTDLSVFPIAPTWDSSGWTIVYQTNEPPGSTGWRSFLFTSPFEYNGSSNLMMDFSFNNSTFTTDGKILSTLVGTVRSIEFRTDDPLGDPLTWSGSNPTPVGDFRIANIRLFTKTDDRIIPIAPTNVTGFVFGQWTGTVTIAEVASNMTITADDGAGHQGDANTFSVLPIAPLGTPFAWLLAHGLTNNGFDVEELIDVDGDFMVAWEEYIADTDPTDEDSVLALVAVSYDSGNVQIRWKGGMSARQYLQCRRDLESAVEAWQTLFTNDPPTTVSTNFTYSVSTNFWSFYRITVERP